MGDWDSPFASQLGREKLFFDAKELVEDQFKDQPLEAKMALIGQLVNAFALLASSDRIADRISGAGMEIGYAIKELGGK